MKINGFKSKFNKENGLGKFKNIHDGESAILFAHGPSIKKYEPFEGSQDCITIGVNAIYDYHTEEEMLNMDYWFFGSEYFVRQEGRDKAEDMDDVCFNPKYKKMVKFTSAYENGMSHGDIGRGNITPERSKELGAIPFENNLDTFTNDLENYATLGHSVVWPALQFILYTGVKKIYLVGCDGGYADPNCAQSDDAHLLHWWRLFKEFVDEYYSEVEIININPISLKGLFLDAEIGD